MFCACNPPKEWPTNMPTTSKVTRPASKCELADGEKVDWESARSMGVYNHCLRQTISTPTCGKILTHCKDRVTSFREKIGVRLCISKLGVTACPLTRFQLYKEQGYSVMWTLATSASVDLVHMLEAALISLFHQHIGCRNKEGSGGDGALNRKPPTPPPYFVYIVGGRADEGKWTG